MFRVSPMSDIPSLHLSFIQLLRLTRQFEVTDKGDRVYGLLGIKTKDNEYSGSEVFITPDFSISDTELWKRLAWKIIHGSQNLSLLSTVQYVYVLYRPPPKGVDQCIWGLNLLALCLIVHCDRSSISSFHIHWLTHIRYSTGSYEGAKSPGSYFYIDGWLPDESLASWVPHWEIVYRATLAPWDIDEHFFYIKTISTTSVALSRFKCPDCGGYPGWYCWFGLSYIRHDIDIKAFNLPVLGQYFKTEAGLRLLARTLTAGRNWYGSLVDQTNESLADSLHIFSNSLKKIATDISKREKMTEVVG